MFEQTINIIIKNFPVINFQISQLQAVLAQNATQITEHIHNHSDTQIKLAETPR